MALVGCWTCKLRRQTKTITDSDPCSYCVVLSCTFSVFHKHRWKCYVCRIYIALICTLKIPIPTHNHSRQSLEAIKSTHLYGLHTSELHSPSRWQSSVTSRPLVGQLKSSPQTGKIFSGASGNITLWDEEKEESKHEEYQCSQHVHIY